MVEGQIFGRPTEESDVGNYYLWNLSCRRLLLLTLITLTIAHDAPILSQFCASQGLPLFVDSKNSAPKQTLLQQP